MKIINSILFFGILIAFNSCGQVDPNKQVDEGKIQNNIYTSQEIGWTIAIPKSWDVIEKSISDEFDKKGKDAIEQVIDVEIDMSQLKHLIGFQKNQFNLFQSTSEPFELEYEGEWEENNALLKELIYNTYDNLGIKVDSTETNIEKIDGFEFKSYEFTIYAPDGNVILNQLIYSRLINGFDFSININYNNESDKKEMLKVWRKSKFKK